MAWTLRTAMAVVAFFLVTADTAAAQDPTSTTEPADIAEFTATPVEGPPGMVITITGRCIFRTGEPADRAAVHLFSPNASTSLARADLAIDDEGNVSGTITVPLDTPPGDDYFLAPSCDLQDFGFGPQVRIPVTVTGDPPTTSSTIRIIDPTAPPTSTPASVLARTGANGGTRRAGILGVVTVAAGAAALTLAARHRRRDV